MRWQTANACSSSSQVIPTPFVARTIEPLADIMKPSQILVSCTKGILNDTLETPNQVPHACRLFICSHPGHSSIQQLR